MRIGILGPLQVWDGHGRSAEIAGGRPRALLARLALEPGRVVTVDTLVDALWEASPPAGATNALQSIVSRLRRSLRDGFPTSAPSAGPGNASAATPIVVESHPAGYLLALDEDDVDAHRFERLVSEGREALRHGDATAAHARLTQALELWRGPVLADLGQAPFAVPAASRLDELRLSAAEDRHEAALELGRHADVVGELEALASTYPLRERICGLLIRALAGSGRQAEALTVYERTRQQLADELGIDPSRELREIHLAALRGELADTRSTRAAGATAAAPESAAPPMSDTAPDPGTGLTSGLTAPGTPSAAHTSPPASPGLPSPQPVGSNLPSRRTSFVGRDSDIEDLVDAVEEARLVTLHGPGGAGKTRLAIESAQRLVGSRSPVCVDGVWFVELASVGDALDVAPAVLTVLGLGESVSGGVDGIRDRFPLARDALARLIEALATKRAVLVLDNCEHLVAAVAEFVDALLGACHQLRVVTTSREALSIDGEQLHPVGPLALPCEDESPTPEEAATYAAIRLFADRAAAVRPDFELDGNTVAPVVETCRRLDGMPLAIELAAARVRALSPAQIAARLDDRFRLLTNGGRMALARQQTLRAVVEWSWELLEKPERILLRRMAVFSGGASLDAVEQVCGGDELEVRDVLDTVASLIDKSLVEACPCDVPDGDVRYRLLETVRAYAGEQLVDAGEEEQIAAAHGRYFRDLAERAEPFLRRREQVAWMVRLGADYDNILGALRRAIQDADTELAVRIASVLGYYWMSRGGRQEGGPWLWETLSLPDPNPLARRALVHFYVAINCFGEGTRTDLGIRELARARMVCRRTEPEKDFPFHTLVDAIWAALVDGRRQARGALTAATRSPDPWIRGMGHCLSMLVTSGEGDIKSRDHHTDAAMAEFMDIGDRLGISFMLGTRANSLAQRGDHAGAMRALQEALRLMCELGTMDDAPSVLASLSRQQTELGDHAAARRSSDFAMSEAYRLGTPEARAMAHVSRGWLAYREGDLDAARAELHQARSSLYGHEPSEPLVAADQAHVEIAAGDLDAAAALLDEAFALSFAGSSGVHWGDMPDLPNMATLADVRASLAASRHEYAETARLLGISASLRGMTDLGSAERAEAERKARQALGDEGFEEVYAHGTGMSRDEALAHLRLPLTSR
ncbi:AfsR/SARP family transcriptional regulator [Phytoactinopolyspora halophila]|uniref:AfsR/SARP family transcriptional regulator n=1 Tax=Phytoactinopolyspora halophila TaxID=1981511 RepID=UPI0013145661|nr:BTAD domain-containing putative transcriptional regulator [Phytoactinopolyspora halophila]